MQEVNQRIFECGIIPVIKLQEVSDSVPLCQALADGGLDVAEITLRTKNALESIKQVSESLPNVLTGAGTVLTVEQAKDSVSAGAKFIVTPGFNPRVTEYCLEQEIPIFPGVSSPTEIELALSYGLTTLKFFPAEINGGIKAIKAMCAPYDMVKFMPTGGIDTTNIQEYLQFNKVIACGGSWMAKDELIASKNFAEITRLTKEAVNVLHGFSFFHLGMNTQSKEQSTNIADKFSKAFGFSQRETETAFFVGSGLEILNFTGRGEHGHIAIKTNNVARAISYLKKQGFEFDETTMRGTAEVPTFIYFKEQFGNFAVHLIQ